MNGVQKRGLQAGYKCITLYMRFWLLLLIIITSIIIIVIIIIIIIVIIVFQLKQSAIIKQALIGLACVAWARIYVITGCARETRKGERRRASSPFLSSPLPPQNWHPLHRLWLALLSNLAGKDQGRGRATIGPR